MAQHLSEKALKSLHNAALIISSQQTAEDVLQHIVDGARSLLDAQYAALGVANEDGRFHTFIYSGLSKEDAARMPHLPFGKGLLGAIIEDRRPLRLTDIQADARSVGFPENHPHMASFLGVPVTIDGKSMGNLYLTNKQGAEVFSAADLMLAEMFAAHAAVAIQNARLREEVQRLAVLDERTRIGMDLHDSVIQSIYAVGLTLKSSQMLLHKNTDRAEELLTASMDSLDGTIKDIRNFILDLRPHRYEGDLSAALNRLVREFQANTMVRVDADWAECDLDAVPTAVARALFLSVQNGLANVARHADADQVVLTIVPHEEGMCKLEITDDGVGFDPDAGQRSLGHGLSNMERRALKHGGTFKVVSAPGEGTRVVMVLPIV